MCDIRIYELKAVYIVEYCRSANYDPHTGTVNFLPKEDAEN
jgi:hypothetical protein